VDWLRAERLWEVSGRINLEMPRIALMQNSKGSSADAGLI
jgi:hypothetical protein